MADRGQPSTGQATVPEHSGSRGGSGISVESEVEVEAMVAAALVAAWLQARTRSYRQAAQMEWPQGRATGLDRVELQAVHRRWASRMAAILTAMGGR